MVETSEKIWFAKCLLLGEHVVLRGASALAVPLRNFSGTWEFAAGGDDAYTHDLLTYADYLERIPELPLRIATFREDLRNGLYFKSNIPIGYGAGSSGALVAAVYARYTERAELDYHQLRRLLAEMESYFHGNSSGTDPLICFVERAVKIVPGSHVQPVELSVPEGFELHLIDTQQSRSSGKWVNRFLERLEHTPSFAERIAAELIPATNRAVAAWETADWSEVWNQIEIISEHHLRHFTDFIPEAFHRDWLDGVQTEGYRLKLCGAGGGGFILAFVRDAAGFAERFADWRTERVVF